MPSSASSASLQLGGGCYCAADADPRPDSGGPKDAPFANIPFVAYFFPMTWDVEVTGEWEEWYDGLGESDQDEVAAVIGLLEARGPQLAHPHSSGIASSAHSHMRELRIQAGGRPLRVLYAFDPRRTAILLCGGDKTGDKRWYEKAVPRADALYQEHLRTLQEEGLI